MSLHLSEPDRIYMKHFFYGIAALACAAVAFVIIGRIVWATLPREAEHAVPAQQQRADDRISPVSAVYAGSTGQAAVMATADTATASAPPASAAASGPYQYDASKGKSLFDGTCAACHQATGEGIAGTFPPLKGNQVVNDANPAAQIETILFGRHGSVIDGKTYPGAMPPFGSQFSDLQVADIANYERSSWGNHGKHVTPADVVAIRAKGK